MKIKRIFPIVFAIAILAFFTACGSLGSLGGSETLKLSLTDIEPNFGPIGKALVFEGVEYSKIGEPEFDGFFKNAAKINGLIMVSSAFSNNLMESLKKTAMDIVAKDELKNSVKELVGNKPVSEYTTDDLIAVTKLGIQKRSVNTDIIKGYVESGANALILVTGLVNGEKAVKELISTGASLSSKASSLSPTKAPGAVSGVSGSLSNLKSAVEQFPTLVKDLTKLSSALSAFASI